MYETFEHTADVGLRVRAPDRAGLFAEAARGLFAIIVANPEEIRGLLPRTYRIAGQADDYLLLDWLNELLHTCLSERLLLTDFTIELDGDGLRGACRGELIDPSRHDLQTEIKAVTYHQLQAGRDGDGWLAEVIVDI